MFINFEFTYFPFSFLFLLIFFFFLVFFLNKKVFLKKILIYIYSKNFFNFQIILLIPLFIIFLNFFSLIPYRFRFSSIQSTFFLSWMLWSSIFFFLFFKNLNKNISHFLPTRTPFLLIFLLIIIETISNFTRPISLRIRLIANITARHLLIHLISLRFFNLRLFRFFLLPLLLILIFLEMCVAAIQSYVFSMLLNLYTIEGS